MTDTHDQRQDEDTDAGSAVPVKKRSSYGLILILAVIAIGLIAYLKSQKVEVGPTPPPPEPKVDYSKLIQVHADQASRRNLNALKVLELDVNRVVKEHEGKLSSAAREAAKEAADYGSCCKIVYYLAWDKVKGQDETEAYLNREIKPFLDPATQALGTDVDAAVKKLDYELRRSTVQLANDLAALAPAKYALDTHVDVGSTMSLEDFRQSLKNLGFNATGISVSLAFDAVALCKSQLVAVLWKKITAIAARMFGKQVAKVAASGAVAAADGPFPVGDIIALGGIIWTGYDVHALRKQFEREITTSLDNLLADARHGMHKQALDHATDMVKQYQKLQDEIGSQTLEHVTKRGE